MRKNLLTAMLVFVCLFLVACDPPNYYHPEIDSEISSIELIEYQENDVQSGREIQPFCFEKVVVLKEFDKTKTDELLTVIKDIYLIQYFTHPNRPSGKCFKINFDDGTFEIMSENRLVVHYGEDGTVLDYIGVVDDTSALLELIGSYD